MSEIERVLNNCIECVICLDECDFLQKYVESPRELVLKYLEDEFIDMPTIPYSCNKCALCKFKCPQNLDIGKMTMEMCQKMVRHGIGPLSQHAPMVEAQEFYVSDEFKAIITSDDKTTRRVFFPGCSLSAYSPELVIKCYEYLNEKLPGTGIILGCCGGPTYLLGDNNRFESISRDIKSEVEKLGADQIIVACPFCYSLLKEHKPELNPVSLYTVLDEIGVPEEEDETESFNIHDPCTTRYEPEIQASARSIVKKAGYNIMEIPHSREESHCCGMGGMVYVVDEELGKLRTRRTLDETSRYIVTYCATCRETLQGQGGHVIHLLDLLFNQEWKNAPIMPPNTPESSTENMKCLKRMLTEIAENNLKI